MSDERLDKLGRQVIKDVRDNVINRWTRLINGGLKTPSFDSQLQETIDTLTDEQLQAIIRLIPYIVDGTLHDFLFLLQGSDWIKLALQDGEDKVEDIRQIARGDLQGYIYIWAENYSTKPLSD